MYWRSRSSRAASSLVDASWDSAASAAAWCHVNAASADASRASAAAADAWCHVAAASRAAMSSASLRDRTRMLQWSGRLHWSAAVGSLLADGRIAYASRRTPTPASMVAKPILPRVSFGGLREVGELREGLRDLGTLRPRSSMERSQEALCQATAAAFARSLRLTATAVAFSRRDRGGTGSLDGDSGSRNVSYVLGRTMIVRSTSADACRGVTSSVKRSGGSSSKGWREGRHPRNTSPMRI